MKGCLTWISYQILIYPFFYYHSTYYLYHIIKQSVKAQVVAHRMDRQVMHHFGQPFSNHSFPLHRNACPLIKNYCYIFKEVIFLTIRINFPQCRNQTTQIIGRE